MALPKGHTHVPQPILYRFRVVYDDREETVIATDVLDALRKRHCTKVPHIVARMGPA